MRKLAIAAVVVIVLLAAGLYRAKLGAQEAEERTRELRADIAAVQDDIAVLKAEEAFLARDQRIAEIARDQLGMQPATPDQHVAVENLRTRLGERTEASAPAAPADAPAAPVEGGAQ